MIVAGVARGSSRAARARTRALARGRARAAVRRGARARACLELTREREYLWHAMVRRARRGVYVALVIGQPSSSSTT